LEFSSFYGGYRGLGIKIVDFCYYYYLGGPGGDAKFDISTLFELSY